MRWPALFVLSRSSDPVAEALSAAVPAILQLLASRGSSAPVIVVDGRSGSGKTSLSRRLLEAWPDGNVQLLALDSVYPGWDGLAAGVEHVRDGVLKPRRRGLPGLVATWDWAAATTGGVLEIDADRPLIVEGSGSLTAETRALADIAVWVEASDVERKTRALNRDGAMYEPHWDQWAAQEDEHIKAHDPRAIADLIVEVPADETTGRSTQ